MDFCNNLVCCYNYYEESRINSFKVSHVINTWPREYDKEKTGLNGVDRYFEANAGNADIVESKLKERNADYIWSK